MQNDTFGFGSSEFGQRYGHVVTAGEPTVSEIFPLNHETLFSCKSTFTVCFSLRIGSLILHISCFPFLSRPASAEQTRKQRRRQNLLFARARRRCHRRADDATRLKKQSVGLIVFRPNKRDFKVLFEAEQVDGREARKGLGGIPLAPPRHS